MAGFADQNIRLENDNPFQVEQMLSGLKKLGYGTVALVHTVELVSHLVPAPSTEMWESKFGLKVYTRLTAVLSDQSHLHVLSQDPAKSYDLLAVQPQTDKLFQQCCGSLEVDIIALDMTRRLPFYLKPPQVRQAVERGIHFEILYSPMIMDSTARRHTISTALDLVNLTKGKNLIISSGAEKPIDLRGPYDVINLGLLFGLNEAVARRAVMDNCRAALLHARARTSTAKGVVSVAKVSEMKMDEEWKLKQQKGGCVTEGDSVVASSICAASGFSSGKKRKSRISRQSGEEDGSLFGSKRAKHSEKISIDLHDDQEQT